MDEFKKSGSFEEFKNYLQAWVKESYKEYRVVSESAFSAKNLKGVKISERFIDKVGKNVRRESYDFKVSNEKKIAFTCTVSKNPKLNGAMSSMKWRPR